MPTHTINFFNDDTFCFVNGSVYFLFEYYLDRLCDAFGNTCGNAFGNTRGNACGKAFGHTLGITFGDSLDGLYSREFYRSRRRCR